MNNLTPRASMYVEMHPEDKAALAESLIDLTTQLKPRAITHADLPKVVNKAKIYDKFCHSYPRFSGDLAHPIACEKVAIMPGVIASPQTKAWYAYRIYHGANLTDGVPKKSLDSFKMLKPSYVAEIAMFNTCLMMYLEESIWANPAAVKEITEIKEAS